MAKRPLRMSFPRVPRWASVFFISSSLFVVGVACQKDLQPTPGEEEKDPLTGLTRTEASQVLAQVGEKTITLGQYAAALDRMGKFEKLRYQTPERQKELLEEMIELELLAQEAQRRGLDQHPEVQLRIYQALRDELLEQLRRSLPSPEELSEREVREYYEAHQEEFQEPERKRVLAIIVRSKSQAEKVAQEAQGADGETWGKLAQKYSLDRRNLGEGDAIEWAGDLGFVSAPSEKRGKNADVPEEVRARVFQLEKLGEVAPDPVQVGNSYYVVRLGGKSPARDRSLRDADRTIRVELLRKKFLEKERELEAELRKKYPIVFDEAKLAALQAEYEKISSPPRQKNSLPKP